MRPPLLGVLLAGCGALGGCAYPELNELDDRVQAAGSNVVLLVERWAELVVNLVEAVGPGGDGEEVFAELGGARAKLAGALAREELPAIDRASHELSKVLARLRTVEGAEEMRAPSELTSRLLRELDETEDRLAAARREYNEVAGQYNRYIRTFPQVLTARLIGAQDYPLLEEGWGPDTLREGAGASASERP